MIALQRNANGQFDLPADGWFHLAPLGRYPISLEIDPETGLNQFGQKQEVAVQVLDEVAVAALANSIADGTELLIDYEHHSHEDDGDTEAAGWMHNVEARDGGLYMQARWADDGAALRSGKYRFISPVWLPKDCEILGEENGRLLVRPLRLSDAGLTNRPNLRGLAPLSNRQRALPLKNQNTGVSMLKEATIVAMLTALGLAAEATDEDVLAKLPALKEEKDEAAALQNRYNKLLEEQVESDLNRFSGVIANDAKPKWRKQLLANREDTLALLEGLPRAAKTEKPLTNRATAQTPSVAKGGEESPEAEKRAGAIRNRAAALRSANPKLTLAASYRAAEEEIGSN